MSKENTDLLQGTLDLLQGTLDLLILKTLSLEPMNGWAISKRIRQVSNENFDIKQGSLYPCLHRLEEKQFIQSEWGTSENNRRAKFYALTKLGRKKLEAELEVWRRFSGNVELILQMS